MLESARRRAATDPADAHRRAELAIQLADLLGDARAGSAAWRIHGQAYLAEGAHIVAVDRETPLLINVVGIESPGLSAALALARHVSDLPCIQQRFAAVPPSAVDQRR